MEEDNHWEFTFKWSGPKSTWTEQEWENYRSMPWWVQRLIDLYWILARVFGRSGKGDANEKKEDERSPR